MTQKAQSTEQFPFVSVGVVQENFLVTHGLAQGWGGGLTCSSPVFDTKFQLVLHSQHDCRLLGKRKLGWIIVFKKWGGVN